MTLRLSNGGSTLTFLPDMKCCIPSCGAVRNKDNKTVPYYTFPRDVTLCREWLKEIQLNEDKFSDLSNLHSTLAVCSKHFLLHKGGGMRLCINDEIISSQQLNKNSSSGPKKSSVKKPLKVTTGTQTMDHELIKMLKNELNLDILYGNHIQCRVCARISVQAVNIYSKYNKESNKEIYIQNLINSLMPIEVKPTDTKPLNICVHCIFKLKEYMLLFNECLKNDRNFDLLNEHIKSENKKTNLSSQEKNQACEVIHGYIFDDESQNTDTIIFNDDIKETTKVEHINKSKPSKLTSKTYGFIKQETRQHMLKLVLSTEGNIYDESARKNNEKNQFSNAKAIYIKFMANHIICRDKERISEININKDELKYSKETIDKILKIIFDTMKNQSEKNNSQFTPLPISPLHLDSKVTPSQQVQTTPVIIDGKTHLNIKIYEGTNEIFKGMWKCNRCSVILNNEEHYTKHINRPKPCLFCGQRITPCSKLLEHENEHRKRADGFNCHLCGHQFTTHKNLIAHCKQHQNYKQFCCKICNLQFSNGYGLGKHLRQQHKELLVKRKSKKIQRKKQKCSKCFLWLSSKFSLREHMKTHLPVEERRKICPICKKKFIDACRFKLHVETHGLCPIKCLECPRSFPTQEHLNIHLRCHKITEPVYCDICHRNFKSKVTLKKHNFRIHQCVQLVQKKFACVFCKNVFASKDELLTHRNKHTLKKKAFAGDEHGKIQCNLCHNCGRYTTGNSMNHYCKTKGSNALQFCCQYCTKRFSSKQRLNYHERTHGLIYRFHCTVCSKRFKKWSTFKIHSNSHIDIEKNTCNICGKIFKSISVLNNHIESNHEEKNLLNNPNDLNNQDLDQIHNSVPLPANVTNSIENEPIPDNISDIMKDMITLTELDNALPTVQHFNLSDSYESTMPLNPDFMSSINFSITTPEADFQDFLFYDIQPHDIIPHDIIPQDMNTTNQQSEPILDILDLQSLYDE